jgi:hypothetical protein
MKEKTKIEKTLKELNELYQFYQKIPKIREPKTSYQPKENNKS